MNSVYVEEVKSSLRNAFLQADLALAEDCSISSSSGTTALAALISGRYVCVLPPFSLFFKLLSLGSI